MTRSEQLLLLGFFLVVVGIALLVVGSDIGTGIFVVFPFVFVSGMSPLLALAGIVAFIVLFYLMMKPALSFMKEESGMEKAGPNEHFVRISTVCSYCGGAVPERGIYCPSCGSPLDDGFNQ
jgi:hypothetical protein